MSGLSMLFTPPSAQFVRAHTSRGERYSTDSSSSAASSTLQTPDRANFPRFATAAVTVGAGPSCGSTAGDGAGNATVGVLGESDGTEQVEERMWDDMEAGGLLEVKIGNLLNLTPRLSTCFLPAITPSSDLAFDQDYEVQPDDSPLLPATYVSPHHAFHSIPQFALPTPAAFAESSRRVRSRRTRPSTTDAAAAMPTPFGAKSAASMDLADPFTSTSSSMGRSTSDNAGARPIPGRGLGIEFGLASTGAAVYGAEKEAYRTDDKRQALDQGQVRGRKDYFGRLSFGDASLSIPLPPFFSGQVVENGKGRLVASDAAPQHIHMGTGAGACDDVQERLQEYIAEEGEGNHLASPISSSASIASSKLFYSTTHTRYPSSSSSFSFAPSVHSTSTASSRRSGPPRSISSRTSSRQSAVPRPPPTAFSPPPRTSSLARTKIKTGTEDKAAHRPISGTSHKSGASSAYNQHRRNRASVYTVASVISDRSEIAPSPPQALEDFAPRTGLRAFRFPVQSGTSNTRRQAIYLSRTASNPLDTPNSTPRAAPLFDGVPGAFWTTQSRPHHVPLRRSRSTPNVRAPPAEMSKWTRAGRGLRESQSFVSSNDNTNNSMETSSRWVSQKLLKSPSSTMATSSSTNPPSPGSPFKSRASRFGLSDFWGTKLNPQGIMHIAEPRRPRQNEQDEAGREDTPVLLEPMANIDLDLDLGSELDFDCELELRAHPSPSRAPLTPEDAAVITPDRPRHVRTRSQRGIAVLAAARKARLLESSSSRTSNIDSDDFAVADILSEIEAEDEEYSLFLAEREDDIAAWTEAQTWDWPMPPTRSEPTLDLACLPSQLKMSGLVMQKAQPDQDKGLGLTLSHSHLAGMMVREPKFLKPRDTAKTRKSSSSGKKRSSVKSLSSHGSLTSAESAQSVAEFALLTPAPIHGPSGTSYIDIDVDGKPLGKAASLIAPSIHVECPSTPIAPVLSLGADHAVDMDITPKAPSRRESIRSTTRRSISDPPAVEVVPLKPAPYGLQSFAPIKDEASRREETPHTLKVTPRKYGSSASLPLVHAPLSGSASFALSNMSLAPLTGAKSHTKSHRTDAATVTGQDIGEFGQSLASLEDVDANPDSPTRERKESTFKAWARKRKESKREAHAEMQAAKAARARAQAAASGLLLPASDLAMGITDGEAAGEGASVESKGCQGSTGRASGLELLGAVSLLPPSNTLKSVRQQKSTLSLRSTGTTASASACGSVSVGSDKGSPGLHPASASGSVRSTKSGKARKRLNHLDLLMPAGAWGASM